MALFKLETRETPPEEKTGSSSIVTSKDSRSFVCAANQKISDVIGPIRQGESIHYASLGDWSTHDLLFYLLQFTGPSSVWFTTWAISEFAVRQLFTFVESGLILRLSGIFDYRNGIHKTAELEFLRNITADIKPAKCHAKVTVIENPSWGIAIVGSANYTRNPRIEAGVICTDPAVSAFHRSWIEHELNNISDFENT